MNNGMNKKEYYKNYQFKEFSVGKAVPRAKCPTCQAGKPCKIHPFQQKKGNNQQANPGF